MPNNSSTNDSNNATTYSSNSSSKNSANSFSTAALLPLGLDLLGQVQRITNSDHVRALRIKLGGRVVKEIPVGSLSKLITVALVLVAVLVSTLTVEVEHEPSR